MEEIVGGTIPSSEEIVLIKLMNSGESKRMALKDIFAHVKYHEIYDVYFLLL